MKKETIKVIANSICDNAVKEQLQVFLAFYDSNPGLSLEQENLKTDLSYQIKLSLVKEECFGDGGFDSHVAKFSQKEISLFLPIDLQKLQEAYENLPTDEKIPISYNMLNPIENNNYMEALLSDLDRVILNLKVFTGKDDNYSEIAKGFKKIRGCARGKEWGL